VPEGPFRAKGYENPEYETLWAFGADCSNSDFAAILAANKVCDDYGVDTISTGNAVAFLMECFEKGYISASDLNGVQLRWGDPTAMVQVARQIANRESRAGNWIADGGVRHAAERIGGDAKDFAIHAKGLELPAYDPRGLQGHGLGYAVSTIGGSHQIAYAVQELFGFPEKVDRFSFHDKGRHSVWSNRYIMIFDCAVACGFANAFTESRLDSEVFVQWLQTATGMKGAFKDPEGMNRIFDRIYNVEHAFNVRRGFLKEQDTLPRRLTDETIQDGPSTGHVWHRDALIEDYYQARGWDVETGVPMKATLNALGLGYVAEDLEREGFYQTNPSL
jgi:aldehyde:ferredoxin oxidoreductase